MIDRESQQRTERQTLSRVGLPSQQGDVRARPETPCPTRTAFQRDIDRITHSKSFRRLMHKTQVFLKPEGDHYRTRLTHTLEVSRIARTMARALSLNEDLCEAIAMGHDLGHTPFGHTGEATLASLMADCGGFKHNEQSLRVVDRLEKNGAGLNLTQAVRNGILCHTGPIKADTLEGRLVHKADRIAYINHDIDDALRAELIAPSDLPRDCIAVLGDSHGKRIDRMICDVIATSDGQPDIAMSAEVEQAMMALRRYLFDNIYFGSIAKVEEKKAQELVAQLFHYYTNHQSELPQEYVALEPDVRRAACDYIAGMTDRFAVNKYIELFVPQGWTNV